MTPATFAGRLATQGRREQLAIDLANGRNKKSVRILTLPLFEVATEGRAGMESTYAKAMRMAKQAA